MQTYNVIYSGREHLQAFCREKELEKQEHILVQVFSGICKKEFIGEIQQAVRGALPQAKVIGATTASEILDGKIISNSCILAISVFKDTKVATYGVSHKGESQFLAGQRLAQTLFTPDTQVLILFGDGLNTNGEEVIQGLDSVNPKVVVAGGLAGDNDLLEETFVFTEAEIFSCGVVGAVLENKDLQVYTGYNFDWEGLGRPLTITSANRNCIYTIDHLTASEAFGKYLGDEFAQGLPHTGQEFPLMAEREGSIVSRPVIGRLEGGGMVVNAVMREGEQVRFGYANFNTILASAQKMHEQMEEHPMESVFVYYCTARLGFLKSVGVTETLPKYTNVPVSGFYSYGEFSQMKGRNNLVCQTMTVLVLSENPAARGIRRSGGEEEMQNPLLRGNRGLYNLIKVTSKELEDANQELTAMNEELLAMTEELNHSNQELEALNSELNQTNETLFNTLEELRTTQEYMLRAEKMAALGNLVAGMSHEINTPVGIGITASSHLEQMVRDLKELCQNKEINRTQLEEYLEDICQASQIIKSNLSRAAHLVSSFKQVSVDQSSEALRRFVVLQYLDEIITSLQPQLKNNQHPICIECPEDLTVTTYPGALYQIISNLVLNSLFHAFDDEKEGRISIQVERQDKDLKIIYKDNGKGMDKRVQDRIFEPFFTTRRGRGGTGLGLYVIYNVITQKLGGSIRCNSEPGKGTEFVVNFPVA